MFVSAEMVAVWGPHLWWFRLGIFQRLQNAEVNVYGYVCSIAILYIKDQTYGSHFPSEEYGQPGTIEGALGQMIEF